jgi:hypothetical protein
VSAAKDTAGAAAESGRAAVERGREAVVGVQQRGAEGIQAGAARLGECLLSYFMLGWKGLLGAVPQPGVLHASCHSRLSGAAAD